MSNISSSDFIDFAFRETHLDGVCIGGFGFGLPLCSNSSSSCSSFVAANAQRRLEQFIRQKYAAYEISKSRGKRALPGSNIIINSLKTTELIRSPSIGMPLTKTDGNEAVWQKGDHKMQKETNKQAGEMGSTRTTHHGKDTSPSPTTTTSNTNFVINKSKPSFYKKAKAGHKKTKVKARAKSMERVSMEPTEEEYRRLNEDTILSRVIQFERALGRQPCLIDLLRHFTSAEIDAVRESLDWLYPGIFSIGTTVPELIEVRQ